MQDERACNSQRSPRRPGAVAVVLGVCLMAFVLVVGSGVTDRPAYATQDLTDLDPPVNQEDNADAKSEQNDESRSDEPIKPGREVRLILKDGRKFTGIFVSRDRLHVTIKIVGIETPFSAFDVDTIEPIKTFEETYTELKKSIAEDDYVRRYELAEWLHRRKKYKLAAEELESILDVVDDFPEARDLLRLVTQAIELESAVGPGSDAANRDETLSSQGSDASTATTDANAGEIDAILWSYVDGTVLTDDEINLLRVYEIDLRQPPRLLISRETIDRLFDGYGDHESMPKTARERQEFYAVPPADILDTMFRVQARDLYSEVRVLSEPVAFSNFRFNVHRRWLVNSCAASACHGGKQSGDFFLFNRRPTSDATVYTNFLILDRTLIDDRPLIDYENPEDSLLLMMGLPVKETATPHPEVPGWRPVFRNRADGNFVQAVEWIRSMYTPHPDYPVEFEPPTIRTIEANAARAAREEGMAESADGTATDEIDGPDGENTPPIDSASDPSESDALINDEQDQDRDEEEGPV